MSLEHTDGSDASSRVHMYSVFSDYKWSTGSNQPETCLYKSPCCFLAFIFESDRSETFLSKVNLAIKGNHLLSHTWEEGRRSEETRYRRPRMPRSKVHYEAATVAQLWSHEHCNLLPKNNANVTSTRFYTASTSSYKSSTHTILRAKNL